MLRRHRLRRPAFTLVELLVACGLVVLILTILAVAFGAATESLGRLKGTGDMASSLRVATDRLKADLNAPHFDAGETTPAGLRLSDLKFHLGDAPPTRGYFRIQQGAASLFEGADSDGFASTRATNHAIEFTTKRESRTADDLFSVATVTPGLNLSSASDTANGFSSKWARVRWQLGNPQTKNGVQTFTLFRSMRAVVPQAGIPLNPADLALVSARADGTTANLNDLSIPPEVFVIDPTARIPLAPAAAGSATFGDDIVLTDVLSFEVKATWEGGTLPRVNLPFAGNPLNLDYPYDDLPLVANPASPLNGLRMFDTWSTQVAGWDTPGTANALPNRIRITGVLIKIRVFDPKHNLARQVTFQVQQ